MIIKVCIVGRRVTSRTCTFLYRIRPIIFKRLDSVHDSVREGLAMASVVLLFVEDESCTRFSIGHI